MVVLFAFFLLLYIMNIYNLTPRLNFTLCYLSQMQRFSFDQIDISTFFTIWSFLWATGRGVARILGKGTQNSKARSSQQIASHDCKQHYKIITLTLAHPTLWEDEKGVARASLSLWLAMSLMGEGIDVFILAYKDIHLLHSNYWIKEGFPYRKTQQSMDQTTTNLNYEWITFILLDFY